MHKFIVTMSTGYRIATWASSAEQAIRQVCAHEGAPQSSVTCREADQ